MAGKVRRFFLPSDVSGNISSSMILCLRNASILPTWSHNECISQVKYRFLAVRISRSRISRSQGRRDRRRNLQPGTRGCQSKMTGRCTLNNLGSYIHRCGILYPSYSSHRRKGTHLLARRCTSSHRLLLCTCRFPR